jgi:hypothetical protein
VKPSLGIGGNGDTDVRHVLPSIQVPILVLHRTADRVERVEQGRYIAEHVPGARLIELGGEDHIWPMDDLVPHIAGLLDSIRAEEAEFDCVLATVLFTDIVGSTERAGAMGDRAWHEVLERHHETVRALLGRYRGKEVDTAGDGFLATFDGPARAIRCAQAIRDAIPPLGLEVRAGLHTGECETIDGKVGGIAVVIGAGRSARRSLRGARVPDGEGPGRGLRPPLRRCRRARAEGRPPPVAAPPSGGLILPQRHPGFDSEG